MSAQQENYELVWSDEFDGNGAIDATKWYHQTQLPNGNSCEGGLYGSLYERGERRDRDFRSYVAYLTRDLQTHARW